LLTSWQATMLGSGMMEGTLIDWRDEQLVKGPLYVLRQPSPWSLTSGFAERDRDALTSLVH